MKLEWRQAFTKATDIKESTKRQYIANMERIISICGTDDVLKICTNPVKVINHFQEHLGKHSVKLYMSTINSLFKHIPELAIKYPADRETWKDAIKTIGEELYEIAASGEPSQREMMGWVDWKNILAKEKELAATMYGSDDHMLLATYTLIEPMRGDFGQVRVCVDEGTKAASEKLEENHVFLSDQSGQSTMTFYDYKTNKAYGVFNRKVPDDLVRIWSANLNASPRNYLFVDRHGYPYLRREQFVKLVNATLLRIFKKNLTIRLLRHSFISCIDYNNTTTKELNEISKNMQHSVEQQLLYRRRVPEMNITTEKKKKKKKTKHTTDEHSDAQPPEQQRQGRIVNL